MGIRSPGVLAAWSVAGIKWFRPLLGECVDSTTASQTVGRTLPPARRHGDSDWAVAHRPSWPTKAAKPGLFPVTEDLFAKTVFAPRADHKVAKVGPRWAKGQIC
eukprot:scaffold83136_cov51-Phaeocystis_antarctica.AAC.1